MVKRDGSVCVWMIEENENLDGTEKQKNRTELAELLSVDYHARLPRLGT